MPKALARFLLIISAVFMLLPAVASADAKPYFKVYGGDVFAGGWINSGETTCSTTDANYQAPTFNPLTNQYKGGILAFASLGSSPKGASTNLGALAMGEDEYNTATSYGFYYGDIASAAPYTGLVFSDDNSNGDSSYGGGFFAGNTQQTHCIPDYYTTEQNSPTNLGSANTVNLSSLSNKQYIVTPVGASVNIAAAATTIAAGQQTTLFVNGNAYIGNNIAYASGYNIDNVPKLTIVVKGNIYIDPSVSQIDGLYIAQPTSGNSNGEIWTCHDSTAADPDGTWLHSNCANKLTINGAVTAKQVVLDRINGDLASAPANEASTSSNIAEVINYIPAMVIDGPFFNSSSSTSQSTSIDSVISLPPVF